MKFIIAFLMAVTPLAEASSPTSMEILNQWDTCSSLPAGCEVFEEKELLNWEQDLLNPDLSAKLLAIAEDQANIWGDTILEGDYIASGETNLDEVTAIYYQKNLVGYQIRYSQSAHYTGSCDYDYENEETLAECTEGSISETLLVTADLKNWDITQDGYANFED